MAAPTCPRCKSTDVVIMPIHGGVHGHPYIGAVIGLFKAARWVGVLPAHYVCKKGCGRFNFHLGESTPVTD
jgi:hypothetical protein